MLDQIINLVKSQAMGAITNNTEIPADKKEQAVNTTTQAITDGLKQNLSISNISQFASLLSGDAKVQNTTNPLVETIKNTVATALTQKAGLSSGIATSLASSVVPSVFSALANRVKDPNDQGFDIKSLLSSFVGNKQGNDGSHSSNILDTIQKTFF